jgi:DNA polymerase-3 subunit gamma/tau
LEKALKSGVAVTNTPEVKTQEEKPEPVEVKETPKEAETAKESIPDEKEILPPPPAMADIPKVEAAPVPEDEPTKAGTVKAEPPKPKRPSVDLEALYNNAKPFRQWPEVVENIKRYSKGIAAAFSGTNAYESGNYLLIDADSDIPFRLLKESSQRSNLKKAVQEITGKAYSLGPYRKPEVKEDKKDPLTDLINSLKESDIDLKVEN